MILTPRFTRALAYADRSHRGHTRKGTGIPYVSHVLGVASIALQYGADEDQAIAALLHDVVEHRAGTGALSDIERRFGPRVARIVDVCSDCDELPKPPWRERKKAYLAKVANAPVDARLVVCADKLYNARTLLTNYRWLGEPFWERFSGGRDGVLWYYRGLVRALRTRGGHERLVHDFARTVRALLELARHRRRAPRRPQARESAPRKPR